jgi:lysozyme family protein
VDDVRALTRAEASDIYRSSFWLPLMGDSIASGLDLMLFDFGVNVGVSASTRMLQRIIGVAQDGEIGPITARAAVGSPAVIRSRIASLGALQEQYYRESAGFDEFGAGWIARTQRRQAAAMALTIHVPAATPVNDNVGTDS